MKHSTLHALRDRANGTSKKGFDGRKIFLVLEGGGMRGIYLAGMLRALEGMNIDPACFDGIVGSSVGVHLACYFSAQKSDLAQEILLNEAFDERFISLRRVFSRKPILDVNWMVENVFFGSKPFGLNSLTAPITAVCTKMPDAKPELFEIDNNEARVKLILRATAAIPFVAGHPVSIDGTDYVDGGISDQIPIDVAEALGATHILVLVTRKWTRARKSHKDFKHIIEEGWLRRMYGQKASDLYRDRRRKINKALDTIDNGRTGNGIPVFGIFVPADAPKIGRLTKDLTLQKQAAEACYTAVMHEFRS